MPKAERYELGRASVLGAVVNFAGYGYVFGQGNHAFELPMVNWLRDPTLYPGDAILEGFRRFPSVFWKIIAALPRSASPEWALFAIFWVTKLAIFYGIARMARWVAADARFVRIVVVALALAPILNLRSPFGASPLLDSIQTQTPLAIAILVCAAAGLLEGKWIVPAALAGIAFYLSAIHTFYMIFVFAALAIADFREKWKSVLGAAAVGAGLMLPWVWRTGRFSRPSIRRNM